MNEFETTRPGGERADAARSTGPGRIWRRDEAEPTGTSERDRDARSAELVELILRASQILRGKLNDFLAEFGLNEARFGVLTAIRSCEPGGCSQTELATWLQQSESNVSTLVERMRLDALIDRLRCPHDRRKRVLLVSERGRDILQRIDGHYAERVARLLEAVPPRDCTELTERFRTLVASLVGGETSSSDAAGPAQHGRHPGRRPLTSTPAIEWEAAR